jgi:excisionase family DNA binding protein
MTFISYTLKRFLYNFLALQQKGLVMVSPAVQLSQDHRSTRSKEKSLSNAERLLPELLTFKEAMVYLRVSRSTLYRLMGLGELTGHKVGSTWRFYRSDLQANVRVMSPSLAAHEDNTA